MGIFSSMSSMVSGVASSLSSSVTSAVKSKASSVVGSVSSKLKSGDILGLASEGLSLYNEGNSLYDKGKSLYGKAKDLLNTDKDDDEKESKKKKGTKADEDSDEAKDDKLKDADGDGEKVKTGKLSKTDKSDGEKAKGSRKTDTYVFAFEIDGVDCAHFQSCEGLSMINEVLEVAVGGENTSTPKFYGNTKYGNVVLSNGLVKSGNDLLGWLQGTLTAGAVDRKSCSLILKGLNGKEYGRWNIFGAMPVGWSIPVGGSSSDGKFSTDLVEKIEMAIERYEYVKALQ